MAITDPTVTRDNRPIHVEVAVRLLWTAWILSAAALCINHIFSVGETIGPGPGLGTLSLFAQAAICILVGRGSPTARLMAVAFMLIAVLPLQMVAGLITKRAFVSAAYTVLSFVLKAISVALLFAADSDQWFARASGVK